MNKIEKIKAEIKRRYNILKNVASPQNKDYYDGKIEAYLETLDFLNSLKEPVSNDLEEAAKNYEEDAIFYAARRISDFFKAGAQWQKQQDQSTIELAEDHAYLAGQEQIIDKACEFLRSHIDKQLVIYHEFTWRSRDEFIEGFKKAMEE